MRSRDDSRANLVQLIERAIMLAKSADSPFTLHFLRMALLNELTELGGQLSGSVKDDKTTPRSAKMSQ
jgi:hypothetical protein